MLAKENWANKFKVSKTLSQYKSDLFFFDFGREIVFNQNFLSEEVTRIGGHSTEDNTAFFQPEIEMLVQFRIFLAMLPGAFAKNMIEGKITKPTVEQLQPIAKQIAGVDVTFNKMKPELDNYWLIIMDSIIY